MKGEQEMSNGSDDEDVVSRWRLFFGAFLKNFYRPARGRGGGVARAIDLWNEDSFKGLSEKAREAILSLRMVANKPGESYEAIAARVDREAANFAAFRDNPTPIGKISLNAKFIAPTESGREFVTEQHQVRDPDKGQASMGHTFERSKWLVLEIIVHDEKGKPLFPLLRTYSNWIGSKSFDLGLRRTFNLKMEQAASANFVRVSAGFVSPEGETVPLDIWGPFVPCPNGAPTDVFASFNRRFNFGIGFFFLARCLAFVALFSWAFFSGPTHQPFPSRAVAVSQSPSAATFYAMTVDFATAEPEAGGSTTFAPPLETAGTKPMKIVPAALSETHASSGVHTAREQADRRCTDLVANLRKAVGELILFMPAPAQGAGSHGTTQTAAASKEKVDELFSHLRVTLVSSNGLMKLKEPECLKYVEGKTDGFPVNSQFLITDSSIPELPVGGEVANEPAVAEEQKPQEAAVVKVSTEGK